MASCARSLAALVRPSLARANPAAPQKLVSFRALSTTVPVRQEAAAVSPTPEIQDFDEDVVSLLLEKEDAVISSGGRKRKTLEDMPFQTYQFALDVLREDRNEKVKQIAEQRTQIENVKKYVPDGPEKEERLRSLVAHLDYLKIQADINNPRVKYNFDNGKYTLEKPIYRYLADKKWRKMRRPILMQRITQMNVMPDILPRIDPVVDVQMRFQGVDIKPGRILNSEQTENSPTLKIIPFTPGEKLVTVLVVNPDVPDPSKDSYNYRLHWMVSNISISNTHFQAIGTGSKPSDIIVPYLTPSCQKGIDYQRYPLIVLEQSGRLDPEALKASVKREGFNTRSFAAKNNLKCIGVQMWRNAWDDHMAEVMKRNGIEGWDKMFVRTQPWEKAHKPNKDVKGAKMNKHLITRRK